MVRTAAALLLVFAWLTCSADTSVQFQTADRCQACHNGMTTTAGADFSIGRDWRTSLMANSSRDPYWQASVRREKIDHSSSAAAVQEDCSNCHLPSVRFEDKAHPDHTQQANVAADGVTCSVCHQISSQLLGRPESYNGNFVISGNSGPHAEYGPFDIDPRLMTVMHSSTGGFQPQRGDHIRSAELCASCHTLITRALGPDGREVGSLPEQVPYQEWLHSDYRTQRTCQSCHMPAVEGTTPIARVLAQPRPGAARHEFVAANFFMQHMLEQYHDELSVVAPPSELAAAADKTVQYLQSEAARIEVSHPRVTGSQLSVDVTVDNLGGHKLPTAYPARRAWLHLVVKDGKGHPVFESGALHPDGSIEGNDNDTDAGRFEPHYRVIHDPGEVEIYESILGDAAGHVTTGLLAATGYLKDNRLLPHGFDKGTAGAAIAVHGDALLDPNFTDHGHRVSYVVTVAGTNGPYSVTAELWYQPIGYRWANNLKAYNAAEPRRFTDHYDAMAGESAVVVVRASSTSE
jgi:hypothetical protein